MGQGMHNKSSRNVLLSTLLDLLSQKKKKRVKGQRSKKKKKKVKNSFIKSNQIKEILIISVYCYLTVYACVNVQL